MQKLAQEDIEEKLAAFPEWSLTGDAMQRTFSFESFADAMTFVNRVAELAEALRHHPDILVRYNKVTLTLTTHEASGLTEKDLAFAREIDSTVEQA